MKLLKNKSTMTLALAFMLIIAAMTVTFMPAQGALIPTVGRISVNPNPVGLGQYVVVNAWVTPQPVFSGPPDIPGYSVYAGLYVDFTRPNGSTDTVGPMTSYSSGTIYFTYIPNALGNWTATLRWAGDVWHEALSSSPPFEFTVQSEAAPSWPPAELPTEYWERPISGENREWYAISGAWTNTGRNERSANGDCFNPYSKAPNSAHVLWKLDTGIGGLIGGEYGSLSYGTAPSKVIMHGRAYFTRSDGIHCVDIRTGEELWKPAVAGSGTLLLVPGPTPYVWEIGSTNWVRHDASTGVVSRTLRFDMTFVPGESRARLVVDDDGFFYFHTYDTTSTAPVTSGQCVRIVKWNSNNATSTWSQGIAWQVMFANHPINATLAHPWQLNGGIAVWKDIVYMNGNGGNTTTVFNATTGVCLWNNILPYWIQGAGTVIDGVGSAPSNWDRKIHGFDVYTGEELWQSEAADYPWGDFWPYQMAAAYGRFYAGNYDGHVRCIDATTGETEWTFYAGSAGTETPYGTWPFYSNPAVADGKVYYATTEHSPTQPLIRGQKLYCIDAYTGDLLWSIAGCNAHLAIADGALVASDGYTSNMYCFDKGPTTTSVSVSQSAVTNGSSVFISGRVLDQSPAQPGTPCVSKDIMSAWMEYLHMQKPAPAHADITGVPVTIYATAEHGEHAITLGTVVSDEDGYYNLTWTPTTADNYRINAIFNGDDSYYSSYATDFLDVTEAPVQPEPEPAPAYTTMDLGIITAVAIAIIIGIVNLYSIRKLRK